jgi:ABC-type transport system involved in multi-copper enzyme maturation permease subunit
MTALLASEIRRIWSRHLLRIVVGLAILGIAIAGVIVAVRSSPEVGADPRFPLTMLPDILKGTSIPLILAGWLLGASFIGADWRAGTITTLLTWEPRRTRVIVAKVLACAASVFALAIALQVVLGGVLALDAAFRGTTQGVGATWLRETSGVAVRAATLASVASVIGFAVASTGRNTAAALGAGFAYLAVIENLVRGLRPEWQRWLFSDNAMVFITGGSANFSFQRTMLQALMLLAIYAAGLFAVSVVMFCTRDVN